MIVVRLSNYFGVIIKMFYIFFLIGLFIGFTTMHLWYLIIIPIAISPVILMSRYQLSIDYEKGEILDQSNFILFKKNINKYFFTEIKGTTKSRFKKPLDMYSRAGASTTILQTYYRGDLVYKTLNGKSKKFELVRSQNEFEVDGILQNVSRQLGIKTI